MISTKQLRYFDALARLGHFGRAAEHCMVTQPALSMQIADLEQQLGVSLIERRSKGFVLTAAGQEVALRASSILVALNDLADYAASSGGLLSSRIRLGIIPTVAPYVLPRLLLMLRELHPQLELQVRETQTRNLISELLDGGLDLVVLALAKEHPEIETMVLRADKFLLAVPPGHTFAAGVRVSPDLIGGERLLLLEEGHCLRDQALAVCDLQPADTLALSSLSTLVQMVASGLGLTLLPEISIAQETARGHVELIRFAAPEPSRMLGLAWRKTSPRRGDYTALGPLIAASLPPPFEESAS